MSESAPVLPPGWPGWCPQPVAEPSRAPLRWRRLSAADLDEVYAIEASAYPHPWSRRQLADALDSGYLCLALCEERGQIGACVVGAYVVLMEGVQEWHLLNVTVAPAHQGQGWGQGLMACVVAWCKRQDALHLWLEVRHSNTRARRLYERMGFEVLGLRKAYYPLGANREDAVVMRLTLNDSPAQGVPAA